jgi:hypothetical protein
MTSNPIRVIGQIFNMSNAHSRSQAATVQSPIQITVLSPCISQFTDVLSGLGRTTAYLYQGTIPKSPFWGQSILKKLGQNCPHYGIRPQILFQFVRIGYRTLLQMKVVHIANRTLKNPYPYVLSIITKLTVLYQSYSHPPSHFPCQLLLGYQSHWCSLS